MNDTVSTAVTGQASDVAELARAREVVSSAFLVSADDPLIPPRATNGIQAALDAPGCERLRDFYSVGPVQRAAVEAFVDALGFASDVAREGFTDSTPVGEGKA